MIKVVFNKEFLKDLHKNFGKTKTKSVLKSLERRLKENPKSGKSLGNVSHIEIREFKFETFRFYFILEGHKLKVFNERELKEIIIKFIKISKKNDQSQVIKDIKELIKKIGFDKI